MEVHVYLCLLISLGLTLEPSSKYSKAENILVLSFFASQSHRNVYDPLLRALINRGHSLTVVSPIKSTFPAGKVKEINGVTMQDITMKDKGVIFPSNFFESRLRKEFPHSLSPMMLNIFVKVCESYYEMLEVKGLLKEKFDLVLVTSFMNECTYGLVHRLNSSFIFAHPHGPEPWKTAFTGVPVPPSFIPMFHYGETDRMSFQGRAINYIGQILYTLWYNYGYTRKLEAVYRKYLGEDIPSIVEIEQRASLILMNRHFSLTYPRPQMPQMVEIAGMHCRPGQPLPKELDDFIGNSGKDKDGFIYFSMGSIVQMKTMPEHLRKTFLGVFAKLKQKVIWKWESETMEDLPKNVMLRKWLPQQDILAHPNIRLFITHGGMLSTEEAVFHGVPLLGIPLYGDQDWNLQVARSRGCALSLELGELNQETLSNNIDRLLKETKFTENVKQLSSIFKDRPEKPLDLAVFSTEYVMRHKGAPFLRSAGADLNLVQYFSVDVISLLLSILSTLLFIIFITVRAICCRKRASQKKINKSSNKMKAKKEK